MELGFWGIGSLWHKICGRPIEVRRHYHRVFSMHCEIYDREASVQLPIEQNLLRPVAESWSDEGCIDGFICYYCLPS